jgi:protein pelota
MQGILRHINFDLVKCVILASPGFVKDQFLDYMVQQAVKSDNKIILENKSKFLLIHASSGFKHSLKGSAYYYLRNVSHHVCNIICFFNHCLL